MLVGGPDTVRLKDIASEDWGREQRYRYGCANPAAREAAGTMRVTGAGRQLVPLWRWTVDMETGLRSFSRSAVGVRNSLMGPVEDRYLQGRGTAADVELLEAFADVVSAPRGSGAQSDRRRRPQRPAP